VTEYIIESKAQRSKGKAINSLIDSFFESLNNLLVYELYFEDIISNAGLAVIKHLRNLVPITEIQSSSRRMEVIQLEYEKLHSNDSPVKNALFNMDTIEFINIIEKKK